MPTAAMTSGGATIGRWPWPRPEKLIDAVVYDPVLPDAELASLEIVENLIRMDLTSVTCTGLSLPPSSRSWRRRQLDKLSSYRAFTDQLSSSSPNDVVAGVARGPPEGRGS